MPCSMANPPTINRLSAISQQVKSHTVGDHAPHAEEPLVEAISQRSSDKLSKQLEPGHGAE